MTRLASPPPRWADPLADAWAEPHAAEEVEALRAVVRRHQLQMARALARLDAARHHRLEGCASIGEWGERRGLSRAETRRLADVGDALDQVPGLEEAVIEGRVTLEAAREVASLVRSGDDAGPDHRPVARWLALAETTDTGTFRRLARHERARRRWGEAPVRFEVLVAPRTRERFRRARSVAQHALKRRLDDAGTLEVVVDDYLDRHDLLGEARGHRRVAARDTRGRYVPMAVRRLVWARDGGRCIFPGCGWAGEMELGHLEAHRDGGDTREENIALQCPLHNDLVEAGTVRVVGPASNPGFLWRHDGFRVPQRLTCWDLEARQQRELHARRALGLPVPAALRDAVEDPRYEPIEPARSAASWSADRRRRVPWLGTGAEPEKDDVRLGAWLDAWFATPT